MTTTPDEAIEALQAASTAVREHPHGPDPVPELAQPCVRIAANLDELAEIVARIELREDEWVSLEQEYGAPKLSNTHGRTIGFSKIPEDVSSAWQTRWRVDMRSFILLGDTALDDVGKLVRSIGWEVTGGLMEATDNLLRIIGAMEAKPRFEPFKDLATDATRLQLLFGVYRDVIMAHGELHPLIVASLGDGRTRLLPWPDPKVIGHKQRETDGALIHSVLPDLSDEPVAFRPDSRLTTLLERSPEIDPSALGDVRALVRRYGAMSPCPYATSTAIASYVDEFTKRCCAIARETT